MKASNVNWLACTESIHPKIEHKDGGTYGRSTRNDLQMRYMVKRRRESDIETTSHAGTKRPAKEQTEVDWDRDKKLKHYLNSVETQPTELTQKHTSRKAYRVDLRNLQISKGI